VIPDVPDMLRTCLSGGKSPEIQQILPLSGHRTRFHVLTITRRTIELLSDVRKVPKNPGNPTKMLRTCVSGIVRNVRKWETQ